MAGSVYDPTPGDPTTTTPSNGKNQGSSGTGFDPSALGNMFGSKLTKALGEPAPVFPKGLYTGMGDVTKSGLSQSLNVAGNAGSGLRRGYDWTGGLIDSGGLTPGMTGGINGVGDMADFYGSMIGIPYAPDRRSPYPLPPGTHEPPMPPWDGGGGSGEGVFHYPPMVPWDGGGGSEMPPTRQPPMVPWTPGQAASGNPLMAPSLTEQRYGSADYGASAPGYQAYRDNLKDEVLTDIGSQFNASGRFGGGSHATAAGRGLTQALSALDMDQSRYGDALQRSDVAAIEAARQRGFDNTLGVADRRTTALGQQYGMQQGGIDNAMNATDRLSSRFGDLLLPSQVYGEVGGMFDRDTQSQRMDEADLYDRTNNADYNRMLELLQAFTGSQGNSGMQEEVPLWQQILGYLGNNVGNAVRNI